MILPTKALATTLILLAGSTSVCADTITLRADTWCPYNCDPQSDRPGYMVEIAREALAPYGHEIEYRTLNWMRSVDQARRGEISGVIGAVPEEVEGFVLGPPLGPLADGIVLRKGDRIDLQSPDAFEGMRIGAVQGYEYYGPLANYIERHKGDRRIIQFVHGDDALDRNLHKLIAGRVDVVAEDINVLRHRTATRDVAAIEILRLDAPEPGYIAFSPGLPQSTRYAAQLTEGLERLRASGRLGEIMTRYNLAVWK